MSKKKIYIALAAVCLSVSVLALLVDFSPEKKKIVYINSYDDSHPWGYEEYNTFEKYIPRDYEITRFYLSASKDTDDAQLKKTALEIVDEINIIKPDLVVAADDPVSEYIVKPYFKDGAIPVVFLGVNIDTSLYGYPYKNATGVIERFSSEGFLKLRDQFFKEREVAFVFAKTQVGERDAVDHNKDYGDSYPAVLIEAFSEFEELIKQYPTKETVFVLNDFSDLEGFNRKKMESIVTSMDEGLVTSITGRNKTFSHLLFKKSPVEQGEEAGIMAMNILEGASISEIKIKYGNTFAFTLDEGIFSATNTVIPEGLPFSDSRL